MVSKRRRTDQTYIHTHIYIKKPLLACYCWGLAKLSYDTYLKDMKARKDDSTKKFKIT